MTDNIEAVLLTILPWSFVLKSTAMLIMWWALQFKTTTTRPLGRRINVSFRDQLVMSIVITLAMFILSHETDATEIDWPYVSIALTLLAIWPLRTAWSHYRVWRKYREIARSKDQEQ